MFRPVKIRNNMIAVRTTGTLERGVCVHESAPGFWHRAGEFRVTEHERHVHDADDCGGGQHPERSAERQPEIPPKYIPEMT